MATTYKPPTGQVGIRQWLKDNGYKDNDIGYENGVVKLKGQFFTEAEGQADGRTYKDPTNLNQALSSYKQREMQNQTQSNLQNTLTGLNDKITQAKPYEFKQYQPFSYDANSDPQYQAALRQAQQNAQTAGNNAMVSLGSRGIGNSSETGKQVAQIQQRAYQNVSDTVLPQLMAQAWQRYSDDANRDWQRQVAEYQTGRDNMGDLQSLASMLSGQVQQGLDNQYRDGLQTYQQGRDAVADDQWNRSFDYNQQRDAVTDSRWQQEFDYQKQYNSQKLKQDAEQFASQMGLNWAQLNQQEKEFIEEMAYRNSSLSASNSANTHNQLMDIWKASGVAPEGIQGVAANTPYASSSSAANVQTAEDYVKYLESTPGLIVKDNFTGAESISDINALESMILMSGLSESEMRKLYQRYKIPMN